MNADKYDELAERAWKDILDRVNYLVKEEGKKPAEISRLLGHSGRSAVSNWINGNSTGKCSSFSEIIRYLDVLGLNPQDYFPTKAPSIKRPGPNAPIEKVEGEDLPVIPVMGSTGAGDAVEFFNQAAEYELPIPKRYYRDGIVGLVVEGISMEPTIQRGSIVGIMPYDGSITDGGIYLIQRPPFGRTIKRIRMGPHGEILLVSDNPEITPTVLEPEGYEQVITGRVVWIWQMC